MISDEGFSDSTASDLSALEVCNLTKVFGAATVLAGLNMAIRPGEILALVGENGSGKSTAIKILSGYHLPEPGGEVLVHGKPLTFGSPHAAHAAGLRFVHQELGLVDTLSSLDNYFLNSKFPTRLHTIKRRAAACTVDDAFRELGLNIDRRTNTGDLPPAVRTGIAVARAIRDDPQYPAKVLVLDEPTATLPFDQIDVLLSVVRSVAAQGVGILYVTHHLDEVFEIADNILVLRDGQTVATVRTRDTDREKLIHLLLGRELEHVTLESRSQGAKLGGVSLRVRNLECKPLRSVSCDVHRGEIVGIAGITGSGRETLLPALYGAVPNEGGCVEVDGQVLSHPAPRAAMKHGVAYLPPDRKALGGVMQLTARENMSLSDVNRYWRLPMMRKRQETGDTRAWFEQLDIRPVGGFEKPLQLFSGGNQQKVLIAKWLRCLPRVLLLDEPTQGVDIGAKAEIHRRIIDSAHSGTAVMISSADVDELVALCHRVLVIRSGEVVAEMSGVDVSVKSVVSAVLGNQA